ncbi:MFS family permease [Azospirillum lipoferum]|uniref:MFS transporter n=1 Tax=Azospirillum lipoferum TaxID=193 RepID=A0A5A9GM90_AZOLI|nr:MULTISPECIES: MFS transporter [Azospirillum]KAA0595570.1 MFS transporter [Azospirillum lipoferum]MCP1611584.1 MFS family permease [Azospirillum lipoferum]MDW5537384.1 MFS transporter [Azospirillum sp. NL1]
MSALKTHKTSIIGFSLLYLAFCISYIDRAAISIALGQIGKDFNLQASELGVVISVFFLGYSLMQIPGGWLADRFGSKYVIVISIALWSVFTVSTSFAWSLGSLIAIRLVFGIAEGGFPPAAIKAVAEMFSKDNKPKMTAFLTSSNYAGSMIAPLVMAPLILGLGWRHAFEVIGFAGIAFAAAYLLLVPNDPKPASGQGDRQTASKRIDWATTRMLLKTPFLWQLVVVWFGLSCVNKGLDSWMPLYLLQQRGLDLKSVGVLVPIPFLLATIATAIGGWVMTRFFPDREKYLLVGSALLTGIFLFAMYRSETIAALIVFQSLVYFFKSFVLATVIALPTKVLHESQIGTGIGMVNLGGQIAGFIAPMVMGFLVSASGSFDTAFGFLIVMTALSVAVATTLRTGQQRLAASVA